MTEDLNAPFEPDWVSPPGESVLDIAEERGWTQTELAQRLGYSEKHISQLVNGKVPLSVEAAVRLERVLGSTAEFWLAREANYQRHLARLEATERHAEWAPWLDELPLKEMMTVGAIPKVRNDAKHKPGLVEQCLRFFGVASPEDWRKHYGGMQMAFRRTRAEQSDVGAISAWLRLGERQAEKLGGGPKYDRVRFEKALHSIRGLCCEAPDVFEPEMRRLLHEAGVILVLIPAIARAHVSGVARWLGPRPVIQLSLYGKTNDRFWFTFFHEAAHILLHANTKEEKKSVFLDDPNTSHSDDPQEQEANRWAGHCLIPAQYEAELPRLRSKAAVIEFAQRIGIHPGIVVGRLQHDRLIEPSWMNDLKQSFRFQETAGA